jgi:hypothetical protein
MWSADSAAQPVEQIEVAQPDAQPPRRPNPRRPESGISRTAAVTRRLKLRLEDETNSNRPQLNSDEFWDGPEKARRVCAPSVRTASEPRASKLPDFTESARPASYSCTAPVRSLTAAHPTALLLARVDDRHSSSYSRLDFLA